MKLIYFTSYTFPSTHAEPYYVRSMAQAFTAHMQSDFLLVIRGNIPDELQNIQTTSVRMPERFRTVRYFFWFPYFIVKRKLNREDSVLMSNDPFLLSIFICWKNILHLKYKVCSDWHQLFEDWRDTYIGSGSDYCIATSERLATHIRTRCAVSERKVLVAYGGIDLDLYDAIIHRTKASLREELSLLQEGFLVGYVGGFRSVGLEKGIDTMIKALPFLERTISMVFVGGKPQHIDEYRALAAQYGVQDRCIFVGKQPFSKVIAYERALDILVIPYPDKKHFREYGFPMKVWEYMASGNPIVYSNLDIIQEVLRDKGFAFTPDDSHALAQSLLSVKEGYAQARKLSETYHEVLAQSTWNERTKRIIAHIQKELS